MIAMAVVRNGVMLAAIWLIGLAPAGAKGQLDELLSHDGLAKLSVKGIELAYARPAGRSRTYTRSAGEMTLLAELNDSETGQVIARVVDREESYNAGRWMQADSWQNANEARLIASRWARILRNGLDRAHGIGKP